MTFRIYFCAAQALSAAFSALLCLLKPEVHFSASLFWKILCLLELNEGGLDLRMESAGLVLISPHAVVSSSLLFFSWG